jgi:hypothetical protein
MVRRSASMVSVLVLFVFALAVPGSAPAALARHSGTVVAVDEAAGTIVIEEMGPWRVKDGQTVIARFAAKANGSTAWVRARRAIGAGPSGWLGEFIEVPQDPWQVKPGDYVTIEVKRSGKGWMALRVTVAELDTWR